ncbi:uncharacterized protein LOC116091828 [Mastomys coucha]|uniref:uncharacterized protein LOC116091828 n=1 Tax=Mastomys coucha TaxID=35658 RepID=UPI0012619D1D|nr:uncharacterized protein LOC116091828 [Mastomys coucha]
MEVTVVLSLIERESEVNTSIRLCPLLDGRCSVAASCLKLLILSFPCHHGLYPQTKEGMGVTGLCFQPLPPVTCDSALIALGLVSAELLELKEGDRIPPAAGESSPMCSAHLPCRLLWAHSQPCPVALHLFSGSDLHEQQHHPFSSRIQKPGPSHYCTIATQQNQILAWQLLENPDSSVSTPGAVNGALSAINGSGCHLWEIHVGN